MAGHRDTKRNRRSRSAKARRRAVGLSTGAGAFLALGMTQLAAAPTAVADEFDAVVEPIINSIAGALGDATAGSAAGPFDGWVHGLEQHWINSDFGQQVDRALNDWFNQVDRASGACGLICNGAAGGGQGGGLIFGDAGSAASAASVGDAAQPMSQNLLVNPNFEIADPSGSGYSGVTIPGWSETGTPTVMEYGTLRGYPFGGGFPLPKLPAFLGFPQHAPPDTPAGDDNFAGGGPVASSSISQTVDLTGAGGTPFDLSADLGGQGLNPSFATTQVTFLGPNGEVLGTDSLKPVTVWDRLGFTGFEHRDITGTVPEDTTSARVTTIFADRNPFLSNYNGAYAANESFTVGDPSLTAAPLTPPTSDVGQLDHVFVIYMENKGVDDILNSPNAPYINGLINSYGFADNFHALSHPSDPNYFRIMGGSDFGLDYNPKGNVIDAPSLMQEMDQAGVSWAGYGQGMPEPGTLKSSGDYAVDQMPFGQFTYVWDNTPAYLKEHLLPQADLSTALQNPSTFPQFAWVEPDEANNMEGPIDSISGLARFLLTQIGYHQYNIAAGDEYLQETISTIENSPTWTDPNEKDAIFITWDEDNNNLYLGFGNEGNNVPMIVIPNSDAVTAGGMQPGHFTTDTYYNQYNLMSTIEDALRPAPGTLDPLTDNDKYAGPMNAFWK